VPPSDAVVLFDGKDLSQWASVKGNGPAPWKVADGVVTVAPGSGGIHTKEASAVHSSTSSGRRPPR
jgi:hypothetical protein